jgi:hypothetical protein
MANFNSFIVSEIEDILILDVDSNNKSLLNAWMRSREALVRCWGEIQTLNRHNKELYDILQRLSTSYQYPE